jgi:hypothetical protein
VAGVSSQIADLVREFGVEPLTIHETRERVMRKHGVSCRLRLSFSSRPSSLLALYGRIGFEYNRNRRTEAASSRHTSDETDMCRARRCNGDTPLRGPSGAHRSHLARRREGQPAIHERTIYRSAGLPTVGRRSRRGAVPRFPDFTGSRGHGGWKNLFGRSGASSRASALTRSTVFCASGPLTSSRTALWSTTAASASHTPPGRRGCAALTRLVDQLFRDIPAVPAHG